MKKIRYASIIPLIGGMPIGNKMATGENPECIISYPEFNKNDVLLKNYMKDVPFYIIDSGSNVLVEPTEDNSYTNINLELERLKNLDFISSTCPCAGLSLLNSTTKEDSNRKRGSDAIQNEWMYKSSEFVLEQLQPKVLFGENAPGLYTSLGKGVVVKLKQIAKKYGYTFSIYKTNTKFHGIPQNRERSFYFFWKGNKIPIFEYFRKETKPFTEFILDIPKDATQQDHYYSLKDFDENPYINYIKYKVGNNWRQYLSDNNLLTIKQYIHTNNLIDDCRDWANNIFNPKNKKHKDRILYVLNYMQKKLSLDKGWWDESPQVCTDLTHAIITKNINMVHPLEDRGLNTREFMTMMGLPLDFEYDLKYNIGAITQNVPTCTAKDMTEQVIKFLNGELKTVEEEFMKQSNSAQRIDYPLIKAKILSLQLF